MLTDRAEALLRAVNLGEVVDVDGVELDLRTAGVDREIWATRYVPGLASRRADGPLLVFPSSRGADRHRWIGIVDGRKTYRLKSGDRVRIDRVDDEAVPAGLGGLDHAHHQSCKLAHLAIVRAGGLVENIDHPIRFWGRGAVTPFSKDFARLRAALLWRLRRTPDAETANEAYLEGELAAQAYAAGNEDASFAVGYWLGRAEALELAEAAGEGRRAVERRLLGPKARSHKRRMASEHFRVLASQLISADIGISLHRCVTLISQKTGANPQTVRRQIIELFGRLPGEVRYRSLPWIEKNRGQTEQSDIPD